MLNYFHDYMIMILLFILVFVTYLFLAILSTPLLDKYTFDSHSLETFWTIFSTVILLLIAFPSLYLLCLIYETSFHALDVDNRLVLPTLTHVPFLVTSAGVLPSWTVPVLGTKADACPGRLNYLATMSPYSGVFYGQCSEICGSNHSLMLIVLEFVPIASYLAFISSLLG